MWFIFRSAQIFGRPSQSGSTPSKTVCLLEAPSYRISGFIIQLIFLQQFFPIPVPFNITRYCMGVIAGALGLRSILATTIGTDHYLPLIVFIGLYHVNTRSDCWNSEMFWVSKKSEMILRASAWKGFHKTKRASENCSFTTCALIRINTFERKVTDILCKKRHDAAVGNILLHVHITVIALVGCIFTHLRLMKEIL